MVAKVESGEMADTTPCQFRADVCPLEVMDEGCEEPLGDDELEGQEEAVKVKLCKDPGCPTAQERAEHEATHLPFRSWCRACVEGRQTNRPHASHVHVEGEVPSVLLDYGFISKVGEEKSVTVLVMKDRESRILMADVVQRKGTIVDEAAEQATENVLRLGHRGKLIVRADNEPALLALREEVMERLKKTSIPEAPPPGESSSNGSIENAVGLFKAMLRVHVLALEAKIEGEIPTHHPVMAWLVKHTAECISKYMVGRDGKTPY